MSESQSRNTEHSALILAGAVAKGAFEAGVIESLLEAGIEFTRLVGTSAGALNAVVLAVAIRGGRAHEVGKELARLWEHEASLTSVVSVSPSGVLGGRGLADKRKLLALLREHVKPVTIAPERRKAIHLTIVTTPLCGVPTQLADLPMSTYEKALHFQDGDFDSPQTLERIFEAAVASAAFPGLFTPNELGGLGPCVDGGIVNNTPIAHALHGSDVQRIFVALPVPLEAPEAPSLRGLSLFSHLIEILIDERFYRDVRTADEVNRGLEKLEALCASSSLTRAQHAAVLEAIGWSERRKVEIVQVRPRMPLEGSAFTGFLSSGLRRVYVQLGREAARESLQRLVTPRPFTPEIVRATDTRDAKQAPSSATSVASRGPSA